MSGNPSVLVLAGGALGAAIGFLANRSTTGGARKGLAPDLEFAISRAQTIRQGGKVGVDELLEAINEKGVSQNKGKQSAQMEQSGGLTKRDIEETMQKMLGPQPGFGAGDSAIDKFTRDLTMAARMGKLDPVICRDEEIRRCIHILSRRTKNNPVLIGESGVGKTVTVEGLAQRIIAGDVPSTLMGVKILELDLGSLTAGCMMPGEFEERLKAVITEVAALRNLAILFIDDIHNLVPAMGMQGATMMDGGSLLKPALSRGEIRCIGATSIDKFKKTIEKDAALERRFQQVLIDQPSVNSTISILRGLRVRYESYHGIGISEGALQAAAHLAARYISGRFLPDKAIDLMDEATSQVKMEQTLKPEALDVLERLIGQLEMEERSLRPKAASEKAAAHCLKDIEAKLSSLRDQRSELIASLPERPITAAAPGGRHWTEALRLANEIERMNDLADEADDEGDVEQAVEYRTRVSLLEEEMKELGKIPPAGMNGHTNGSGPHKHQVLEGDVAKVVSRWTGIPITKLVASEREKLLHLTDELHRRIIGQEEAVGAVAEAIQRSRADLADENGPISSFMFLGPTGVGKTELAKALAAYMFNSEDAMVRLDMSEYMEKHAVSRLIGAPPGYVGYDEGGLLTDAVKRRPYSVVLFDEIEKAHVDVFNILLQILDDGRVTDTQGSTISFKNCLIIMTSNLGSAEIFTAQSAQESDRSAVKDRVMAHVKDHFRPEFINRVDDFITFQPLKRSEITQIVRLRSQRLIDRMSEKRMKLDLTESAVEFLASVGYDPLYGARPVKRALQRELQTVLAKALLRGDFQEEDTVIVTAAQDGKGLDLSKGASVATTASVEDTQEGDEEDP